MNSEKFENLLNVILDDNPSKKKLDKLGMTKEELEKFKKTLMESEKTVYHRILSEDEKKVLTPAAYGYLINLLNLNSIDNELFEKVIFLSMQLNTFLRKKISKSMMDELVNYLIFSGQKDISIKDILDIFFTSDTDNFFDEELN
jgi:hypothetical protein